MDETFGLQLLKSCDLFKDLSDNELKVLYSSMIPIKIQADEVLITQGEISDCMYVLLSGRLLVKSDGKVIAQIGRGQTVGEMGVITDDPRSATVVAMRESLLLKLEKSSFTDLWMRHPTLLFEVTKIITKRLRKSLQPHRRYSNDSNIAVLQGNEETYIHLFMEELSGSFDRRCRYKIVRSCDFPASLSGEEFYKQVQDYEHYYDFVFYIIPLQQEKWRDLCLEYADRILVLANGGEKVNYDPAIASLLTGGGVHPEIKKILVLLHDHSSLPSNTLGWLQPIRFYRYYHVFSDDKESFARLLRLINGTAIGLVLSGGGARSWAEVGIVKYLYEHKIPIDALAGTSAGAINAATLVIARDFAHYLEIGKKFVDKVSFREYTIPFGSLLSSASITMTLQEVFGELKIEDLKKIVICIAGDLIKSQQVEIQEGLLWHALRCSVSIPGIYPPVHLPGSGQLLVDGAVVNNMPVDVMKNYLEGLGNIISVDISSISDEMPFYDYPLALNWMTILKKKIFSRTNKLVIPSIANTLYKGLLLSSSQKTKANTALSTIHIRPNVASFPLLDKSRINELIDLGYAAAQKSLANWQHDLNLADS